jgi:hypothetical protein
MWLFFVTRLILSTGHRVMSFFSFFIFIWKYAPIDGKWSIGINLDSTWIQFCLSCRRGSFVPECLCQGKQKIPRSGLLCVYARKSKRSNSVDSPSPLEWLCQGKQKIPHSGLPFSTWVSMPGQAKDPTQWTPLLHLSVYARASKRSHTVDSPSPRIAKYEIGPTWHITAVICSKANEDEEPGLNELIMLTKEQNLQQSQVHQLNYLTFLCCY